MILTATIHRDDDGSYWAEVDDLPGCFASGTTLDGLLESLTEAASLYLTPAGGAPVDVPPFTVEQVRTEVRQPA